MRLLLIAMLLALTPPQLIQNNNAGNVANAVIEGRVVRPGSLDPIPNVQITLSGGPSTPGSPQSAAALELTNRIQALTALGNEGGINQATIDNAIANAQANAGAAAGQQNNILTDSSGHFRFKDLAPGKYTVRASLEGYFGPTVNGSASTLVTKSINVEAQKPVPSVDIYMVKGGVISGRIRDPNGQPASGVTISATRETYANGRAQWTTSFSKPTNDLGEYRIFWAPPGDYNIGFLPRNIGAVPNIQDTWERTFYPGVSDTTAATTLTVKDGGEVAGIDFTIQSTGLSQLFKITGNAINPLAVPNATTGAVDRTVGQFFLSPREPGLFDALTPPSVQNALPVTARVNGAFEIRNVKAGSYDLIAFYQAPVSIQAIAATTPGTTPAAAPATLRRYYIDRTPVEVRNSDIEGVRLEIQKGTQLQGRILNQGGSGIPLDKVRLSLHSQDTIPEQFAAIMGTITVDASGAFSALDIAAARYSLQISGLPDGAYVSDVRQGGTSVFDTGLAMTNQPVTAVDVVLNINGASIEGTVQGSDHKPAATATVALVPPANRRQNTLIYKSVQTDDMGHFTMRGITPGDYTVFAWESVPATAWMNSDFLAKFQNRGHSVVAAQGVHLDLQLDLIPADSSHH